MTRLTFVVSALTSLTLITAAPAVHSGDWPQWRGPQRDGKSADTGLLKQWPAGEPKLAWKARGLGKGHASVAVVGDRIYTTGDLAEGSHVIALKAGDGKVLWSSKMGAGGKSGPPGWDYAGPRCTPTIDGDLLFALDQFGQLVCLRTADGKEQWRKQFEKDLGGKPPEWGFSESPLVSGQQLVITPGGPGGTLAALNKSTGALLWRSKEWTDDAQYASIQETEMNGVRQYVQLTTANLAAVSPTDGALVWKVARKGAVAVIPTPIIHGNEVYVTSGYNVGCNLFKVTFAGGKFMAAEVYNNKQMQNHHGGVVLVGDFVYGYSEGKGLTCQNLQTGAVAWAEKAKIKKGAVSYADGLLYCREEDSGTVVLVAAAPAEYAEKGRLEQPDRSDEKAWPHPVIANGKLYLRDQDQLFCYDLQAK